MTPANAIRTRILLVSLFCSVVLGGYIAYRVFRPGPDGKGPLTEHPIERASSLSAAEFLDAVKLKDRAIGLLEGGSSWANDGGNQRDATSAAISAFEELGQLLPGEILPLRNLVIARLLALQDARTDVSTARQAARDSAARLLAKDPESPEAHWLAAQIELHVDPTSPTGLGTSERLRSVELLGKATGLAAGDPVYWFALHRAAQPPTELEPNRQAIAALKTAQHLAPRNIYLLTEWLVLQARQHDPTVTETLGSARDVLRPLYDRLRAQRIDIEKLLDDAIKGAKSGQWPVVLSRARLIGNVVRPEEIAKSDIGRVQVHPLEFVLYDFSDDTRRQYARAVNVDSPGRLPDFSAESLPKLPPEPGLRDLVVMDMNLNGVPDIALLSEGRLVIWGRPGLEAGWTKLASIDLPGPVTGLLAADLDLDRRKSSAAPTVAAGATNRDASSFDHVISQTESCHIADPDFVVYGPAGVFVLRNDSQADGSMQLELLVNEGLEKLADVTSAVLVDLDHDADLDLAIASETGLSLWEAGTPFTYTDISGWSTLPGGGGKGGGGAVTSLVPVDWDRDVDIDIVCGDPSGEATGILENLRHGQFRFRPFDGEFSPLQNPKALAVLESDGNVSWDILETGTSGLRLFQTATPRPQHVVLLKSTPVDSADADGVIVTDLDNDGYGDALTWGPKGLRAYRGNGSGLFDKPADIVSGPTQAVTRIVAEDLDRDGDQDLALVTEQGLQLLCNQGDSQNGWITLYPMGQSDNKGRCNHHAIGSMVELRAAGWYQAQVVTNATVHFGLGDRAKAEQLRIVWTNGVPQDLVDVGRNVAICEKMTLKGSCPYVYTWTGDRFEFFTDCLWAAPIGLQTADGGQAPTRPWEYLLIPGDRLVPTGSKYLVQLTEELWEAGYFDQVELLAVDHPADCEIYTNEKVGPAEIAEPRLFTVSKPRLPRSAQDQRGRDVLGILEKADGRVVTAFDHRIRQGLTTPHWIELDLGDLDHPSEVILFLTGWIMPTDTSLNVAFRQDPETDGPQMPSVWVQDEDLHWRQAMPFMGFPGGKTKTIAVDLSDCFLSENYRVQIRTSAEIYWDRAFISVDERRQPTRSHRLRLVSADMAYRGFSRPGPYVEDQPRTYLHDVVDPSPLWPPMRGRFTRYGDVQELLLTADDQLAVIGAGDAITLAFEVPAEPPVGWKRDFILRSIGYDKDADLNTLYGQTVEPLPFRDMAFYPYALDDPVPHSAAYTKYVRDYQTREQNPLRFWRQVAEERETVSSRNSK